MEFVGEFNYYERMIPSVAYHESCIDCKALQTVGKKDKSTDRWKTQKIPYSKYVFSRST